MGGMQGMFGEIVRMAKGRQKVAAPIATPTQTILSAPRLKEEERKRKQRKPERAERTILTDKLGA